MTVKISCSSNKSEALLHHMGKIGRAKGTMALRGAVISIWFCVSMPPAFNLRS